MRTSLLNILLLVPFGFGLPFITDLRLRSIVGLGALVSIGIEALQLLTGLLAHMTFRIADINDVIVNSVGVAIGALLFVGFARLCRHMAPGWERAANPLLRYIAERSQLDQPSGVTPKTIVMTALIAIVVASAALYGHTVYRQGHPHARRGAGTGYGQSDRMDNRAGAIPQRGDPCGGTGGTGQIVRVGNGTITIKRQDGVVHTVTLTARAAISNAAGPLSKAELQIADQVTLVIPDADNTAATVLVCEATGPAIPA